MSVQLVRANNDSVNYGTSDALQNVAGGTLTCWCTLDSAAAVIKIALFVNDGNAAGSTRLSIGVNGATLRAVARRLDADGATTLNDGAIATSMNVFMAVVANYAGGTLTLYLNGVSVATTNPAGWAGNSSNTLSNNLRVGATGAGNTPWDGRVSDARVYSRILSDDEILGLFTAQGRDSNLFGGQDRFNLGELAPGQGPIASKDKWIQQKTGNSVQPGQVYAEWIAMPRRRRRRR